VGRGKSKIFMLRGAPKGHGGLTSNKAGLKTVSWYIENMEVIVKNIT